MDMSGDDIEELKTTAISIVLRQKTTSGRLKVFENLEDALTVSLSREKLVPGPKYGARYSAAQWESFVRMLFNSLKLQRNQYRTVRVILTTFQVRYSPKTKAPS